MSPVFRAKYVALLRKSDIEIPQETYDQLFKKKWVVFAKSPFACPKNVIEYLGRYTHKIAISNHRIQGIDHQKKQVVFAAKDYKKGGKKTSITLSSSEFIRRFALHILPKGFTRIRHYGILSSSWKKEKLPQLQVALATKVLAPVLPKEPLLHRQCPSCKTGRLHTVLLFDARGPPKDWQRLLSNNTFLLKS